MRTIRETQKKAVQGNIIDYPVSQIKIVDDHTFFITCRNPKTADTFKAVTTAYNRTFPLVEAKTRNYELLEKSRTEFVLRGEEAQVVLNDFAETGLLSNILLEQVIRTANLKNFSCIIS